MQKYAEHQQLMKEWKEARPGYECFVNDGILNEDVYDKSKPRIAMLLKESNDDFVNIAPVKGDGYGPEGNSTLFWRHINISIHVATCAWNGVAANVDDLKEITERKVNSIAYIEVKKNAESKPRSDDNEIMEYAIRDRDYLKRQLDIIDPQIIFLGGTKKCYDLIEESKHIVHSMHKGNNRLIVDFYHPSFVMAFDAFLYHLSNNFYSDEIARIIETMRSMS